MPSEPPNEDDPKDALEERLAACIECFEEGDTEGLEAILAASPVEAPALRAKLEALSRVGMLDAPAGPPVERVGPYRVIRSIGSGGMGEVFLAEHADDGREVALKVGPRPPGDPLGSLLGSESPSVERAAARFEREAHALEALDHPGIVPVVGSGSHGGRSWIAMEYVRGAGLDQILRSLRDAGAVARDLTGEDLEHAVPGARAGAFHGTWTVALIQIIAEVADALSAAHAAGVVHRDVKPANILIREDGRAQVLDFGIAHLDDLPTLTLTGEFAGTPFYVAPEQVGARRDGVDGRADVFALAVTLYECLLLRRPFEGETAQEVLTAVMRSEPPLLHRTAPYLPPDLGLVCARALEKDRGMRYASMGEFAAELRRVLALRPVLARPRSRTESLRRWARRNPWQAVAAGLGAAILVGVPVGLVAANASIRHERDLARDAADVARQETRWKGAVVDHLVGHFEEAAAEGEATEVAERLLDRGVERLEGEFGDQPTVRAALLHASGRGYLALGRLDRSRELLNRAYALLQRAGQSAASERSLVLVDLARVHLREGSVALARDLAEQAVADSAGTAAEARVGSLALAVTATADVALGGQGAGVEELGLLGLAGGINERDFVEVFETLGHAAAAAGEADDARMAFARALEIHRGQSRPDAGALARIHGALADLEARVRGPESEPAQRHALQRDRFALASQPAPGPWTPYPHAETFEWATDYLDASGRGVAAIQAGRIEAARAEFKHAHEVHPVPAIAAYNLACVEARAGDHEQALAWLEAGRQLGLGASPRRLNSLRTDPDLESLRPTDGWRRAMEAFEAQLAEARRFRDRALLIERGAPTRPAPVLVVLHGRGSNASHMEQGRWSELAEKLGASLFAPGAPFLTGPTPEEGFAWTFDPRELGNRAVEQASVALDQTLEAIQSASVDPSRVFVVGEGSGAQLALDFVLRSPGTFRGALLLDPELASAGQHGEGRLPAALGVRLGLISSGGADAEARTLNAAGWFEQTGGWGDAVRGGPARPAGDFVGGDSHRSIELWVTGTR